MIDPISADACSNVASLPMSGERERISLGRLRCRTRLPVVPPSAIHYRDEGSRLFRAHASARAKNFTTCSYERSLPNPTCVPSVSSPFVNAPASSLLPGLPPVVAGVFVSVGYTPTLIEHAYTLNALRNLTRRRRRRRNGILRKLRASLRA